MVVLISAEDGANRLVVAFYIFFFGEKLRSTRKLAM
jgi:hypothetical protein